ncbi:hypothetical protein [Nocardiopsis coralliicola]
MELRDDLAAQVQKYYDGQTSPAAELRPTDTSFSECVLSGMHRADIVQELWQNRAGNDVWKCMTPLRTLAAAAAVALLFTGCSIGSTTDPRPSQSPSPSHASSPSGSPEEVIAEMTDLTVPDGAKDVVAETETNRDGRLVLSASFTTDRDGAESFCEGENLGVYRDPEGPSEEARKTHDTAVETVDGAIECRGVKPDTGTIQREILILYPEEDSAEVHVSAFEVD